MIHAIPGHPARRPETKKKDPQIKTIQIKIARGETKIEKQRPASCGVESKSTQRKGQGGHAVTHAPPASALFHFTTAAAFVWPPSRVISSSSSSALAWLPPSPSFPLGKAPPSLITSTRLAAPSAQFAAPNWRRRRPSEGLQAADEIAPPRAAMQTPPPAVPGNGRRFALSLPRRAAAAQFGPAGSVARPRVLDLPPLMLIVVPPRAASSSLECVSSCRAASWKGGGRPYECSVLSCAWNAPRALTGALASTAQCSSCGHAEAGGGWRRRGRSRRSNNSVRRCFSLAVSVIWSYSVVMNCVGCILCFAYLYLGLTDRK